MSQQFIRELELPTPSVIFKIAAASPATQTVRIMLNMTTLLKKTSPALVLVEGDANSVLAVQAVEAFQVKTIYAPRQSICCKRM